MAHLSLAERITASFYAWETRGRGWTLADYPVALEPPHRPFFLLPGAGFNTAPIDDGRHPTFLSRLFEGGSKKTPVEQEEAFEEQPPFQAAARGALIALRLRLPEDFETDWELNRRLLLALSSAREPVAFEVIGHGGKTLIQLALGEDDAAAIRSLLAVYVPAIAIEDADDALLDAWNVRNAGLVVDFGLGNEFFLPLATDTKTAPDRYLPLLAALAQVRDGESMALQVLFAKVANPWSRTIGAAIALDDGTSIIEDAPEYPKLAAEKCAYPLLAVVVRVGAQAGSDGRVCALVERLRPFFDQFARPDGNELIPLANDGYPDELHEEALLSRTSYRTGMLLSLDELVGLVHLPDASVRHESLVRAKGGEKRAPSEAMGHELVLGVNTFQGKETVVTVPPLARLEHTHVIGATGTGKSTLLLNLILQDIAEGQGLAVLDPHGDLIDDILERVPASRVGDIIVFDPSDEEWPVGFNLFAANSEIERNLLASDAVAMFRRLSTSWGDAMTTVLGQAVLAMLAHPEAATLVDLRRFLVDEGFRSRFLAGIPDPEIGYFWAKEFPLIGARSFGPILTRLDTFLRLKLIRNIVGQRAPKLDLTQVIEGRKVFLARLSKGLIGEENAALLGSLLVSKFQQAALARQRIPQSSRTPFYLYIDEFHNFVTPSVASLLAEGRKFGMGLILAHQSLEQLKALGQVESAVLGNTYTRVVFRVGDSDAKALAEGFADFDASDLQNLGRGEAIVRMGRAQHDFNLATLPRSEKNEDNGVGEAIITHSRVTYATAKAEVEQAIAPPRIEEAAAEEDERPVLARPTAVPREELTLTTGALSPLAKPKRAPLIDKPPRDLGKGGDEHRYLQHLIKRFGEERGFRAVIEEQIGDGKSVDVVLRRDALAFAFEISVATEIEHEVENLKKCAARSYTHVFFVSKEKRKRDRVLRALKESGVAIVVMPLAPEGIVGALDALALPPPEEQTVRGYKIKVKRQHLSYDDVAGRRSSVAAVIARSLARGRSVEQQ